MGGPIVLTDPEPIPKDERCPDCGAGSECRVSSEAFGPLHDVCGECGHDFEGLTVPASTAEDEDDES